MLTLPGKCPPDILPVGTRLGAPARLVCAASVESRLPARHGVGGQEGGGGRVGGGETASQAPSIKGFHWILECCSSNLAVMTMLLLSSLPYGVGVGVGGAGNDGTGKNTRRIKGKTCFGCILCDLLLGL